MQIPEPLQQSLVQLQGPDNSQSELFELYSELQPLFDGKLQHSDAIGAEEIRIVKVYLNERRALGVELSNGMHVMFGRMRASMDLYNAAARFVQAFNTSLIGRVGRIAVVDLRYTNGFAVQWKDSSNTKH